MDFVVQMIFLLARFIKKILQESRIVESSRNDLPSYKTTRRLSTNRPGPLISLALTPRHIYLVIEVWVINVDFEGIDPNDRPVSLT